MSRAERSRARLITSAFVGVLVALALIPAYLALQPPWRGIVVRLACAVIVLTGGFKLVAAVRRRLDGASPSALDGPSSSRPRPVMDERFLRLREDLVLSRRSQRYFDVFLRPRLQRLGGDDLALPPERRESRRRGPALRVLEDLIAQIERRP